MGTQFLVLRDQLAPKKYDVGSKATLALISSCVLLLSGCFESEDSCYKRLDKGLSQTDILNGVGLELVLILTNEDLNVCDYTVHLGRVIKK